MDEEDGRPGARALKFGRSDDPRGVPAPILPTTSHPQPCHPERSEGSAFRDLISPRTSVPSLRLLSGARVRIHDLLGAPGLDFETWVDFRTHAKPNPKRGKK